MQLQAQSSKHYCLVVLSDRCADVLSISTSDREFRCQFPGRMKMKRKRIIYGSLAIVVAVPLLIVYYFYLGSTAPVGQQPLVRLDKTNIDSLKKSFNESADSVRVIVMLSPT